MTIDHPHPQEDPSEERPEYPPCHCRRCGRVLQPGRGELYVVSVLAVADPYPPVYTEADLALDVGSEIRRLVRRLGATEADLALDEVYRREVFHLCVACYQHWIDQPAGSE